ncbi:amino acid adenylation domain-containing protein [Streptomyces sp. NPDC058268]|uniref:non-ribosomal peptide synthetase n=1 Tax=Streptomyces sp. NPDC058268 TaxID=3346413 RepID=UPI0036EF6C42
MRGQEAVEGGKRGGAADRVEGYRLSFQQQRIWQAYGSASPSWAQALLYVDGAVDPRRLADALRTVTGRHGALRARYRRVPGANTAVAELGAEGSAKGGADPGAEAGADDGGVEWSAQDLRALPGGEIPGHLEAAVRAERLRPTGIDGAAPLRARLVRLSDQRHALLITTSGLSADSLTLRRLAAELARAYDGRSPDTAPLQYIQYAHWQHQLDAAQAVNDAHDGDDHHELNVDALHDAPLDLPLRRPQAPGAVDDPAVVRLDRPVPPLLAQAVRACAKQHGATTEVVLLACLLALLRRITDRSDATVSAALPGRPYDELRDCAGHFTHWTPIRTGRDGPDGPDAATTFSGVLAQVQRDWSDSERAAERVPASYATEPTGWAVAFEAKEEVRAEHADGVTFTPVWDDVEAEPCAVKLESIAGDDSLRLVWRYRQGEFTVDYIRSLAGQYLTLLEGVVAEPTAPLDTIGVLDDQSHALVRAAADRGRDTRQPPSCLHQIFERQARRSPDSIAVVDPTARLTYRQLDEQADQLAQALRQHGVMPDQPVAISIGHTRHLLVAMLGVLKAGGAYLPLDPELPRARTADMLSRSGCSLILTGPDAPQDSGSRFGDIHCLNVDNLPTTTTATATATAQPVAPQAEVTPENLAYILFTSGSTGVPKGVALPHRALANYVLWAARTYVHDGGAGAMVHSSVAFDLTVTSLFVPLVSGHTVHVDPAWRNVFGLTAELGRRTGLDLLKMTPSHLGVINHALGPDGTVQVTHSLVLGGENLSWEHVAPWRRPATTTRIFNEYGPTEAAVGCTVHEITAEDPPVGDVPIGRPVDGADVYVLDSHLAPVPVGALGEICVGGIGLARGYVADPAGTADRFVPHPFSEVPGQRLYRTGDIGYYGPDGTLHCLGRRDEQIKVRGVRVEPAEVERALLAHASVREAAVVLRPDGTDIPDDRGGAGGGRLTAFLSASTEGTVAPSELRGHLAERLPAAMVPAAYIWLERLPLTANGKIDRDALLTADTPGDIRDARARTDAPPAAPAAPVDALEAGVAAVFGELLKIPSVGVDDVFFDLGGHSILAVRLIAKINAAFSAELPVSVLFEEAAAADGSPVDPATPRALAALLRGTEEASPPPALVTLQSRGEGAPLFCVPGGADAIGFRNLAGGSVLRRPLYAAQRRPEADEKTDQGVDMEVDVEALAERHLAAVRAVRPHGPYLLMGWSMGGLVAFEMAQRLTRLGERVAMLVLVDSYLADQLPATTGSAPVDAHTRAALRYRPTPYTGPTTLLQAQESDPRMRAAAGAAWAALCPALSPPRVIAGDHYSVLDEPFVAGLAAELEKTLQEADAPHA